MQKWVKFASTKTARHKLARFLKEHDVAEKALQDAQMHLVEVTLGCDSDHRPGLAADIVAVIQGHAHEIEVKSSHHRIIVCVITSAVMMLCKSHGTSACAF